MAHILLTIGEFSKMTDIPMRTLHFYDKKGILKPVQVDPQNNYRYYSTKQLLDVELLKTLKFLGVPLEEVKKVFLYTAEEMASFLKNLDKAVDEKVKEIQAVQMSLRILEAEFNKQWALPKPEDVYISELQSDEAILIMAVMGGTLMDTSEKHYRPLTELLQMRTRTNSVLGGIYSLKNFKDFNEIQYDYLFIPVEKEQLLDNIPSSIQSQVMGKGSYVGIRFTYEEDKYFEMYQKLVDYIKSHKLKVDSVVYELFYPFNYTLNKSMPFDVELKIKIAI